MKILTKNSDSYRGVIKYLNEKNLNKTFTNDVKIKLFMWFAIPIQLCILLNEFGMVIPETIALNTTHSHLEQNLKINFKNTLSVEKILWQMVIELLFINTIKKFKMGPMPKRKKKC